MREWEKSEGRRGSGELWRGEKENMRGKMWVVDEVLEGVNGMCGVWVGVEWGVGVMGEGMIKCVGGEGRRGVYGGWGGEVR